MNQTFHSVLAVAFLGSFTLKHQTKVRKQRVTEYLKEKNGVEEANSNISNIHETIPKIIHCTHVNSECIPQKVWDNLQKYATDYQIRFYSDKDCIAFLRKEFDERFVDVFKSLKRGAHKADFFRYCALYVHGGVYLDIKSVPKIPLAEMFDHDANRRLYTCISARVPNKLVKILRKGIGLACGDIYQGIIASYPKNTFFIDLIADFFVTHKPQYRYHTFTYKFYQHLSKFIDGKVIQGLSPCCNGNDTVYLFQEKNEKMEDHEIADCRGGCYNIFDHSGKWVMKSRYSDFPWKSTNKG